MKTYLTETNILTVELDEKFTVEAFSTNDNNAEFTVQRDDDNDDDGNENDDDDDSDDDNDDGGGISTITVAADGSIIYGYTSFYIEGRSTQVATQSTTLGLLSTEANLFTARSIDASASISIIHAGSISGSIGSIDESGNFIPPQVDLGSGQQGGGITQTDIETVLQNFFPC
ncbi:MAG: hypothetical protein F6K09_37510 [Merismopedia sp. SIO2A8]|nr:hypothetical protein [Merismopedia sp. SIO2A8]